VVRLKKQEGNYNEALTEYVKYQKRLHLAALQGKVKWVGNLDKMRTYGKQNKKS
jgi:hypothetical protein